jgi:DNA-binding beta-propeller fold protein YncE
VNRRGLLAAGLALLATAPAWPAGPPASLPRSTVFPICSNASEPLPQYGLALGSQSLWVACRDAGQLLRLHPKTGKRLATLGPFAGDLYSIAAGLQAVWAAQRGSRVLRVDLAGEGAPLDVPVDDAAYLFVGSDSVWVGDNLTNTLIRFTPATGAMAELPVGDGVAAFVEIGGFAWVLNHREATLDRIDLATNQVERLAHLPGDAPERMVALAGSLWITGRGTDLLRVDPATGALLAEIEIGAGGVNLTQAGGRVWVFAASVADDLQGLPFVERVLEVDPKRNKIVRTTRVKGRVAVNGLASDGTRIWIADTTNGRLYRLTAATKAAG